MVESHITKKATIFAKNSVAVFFTRAIDIGVGLVTIALIARYLGVEAYGNYSFVVAFVGLFIPLTYLGLERIAIREIARDQKNADRYLGAVIVTRWILSLIVVFLMVITILFMKLSHTLTIAIIIAMISELIFSSGSIFMSVFKAFERMWYETFVTFVTRIAMFLLVAVVIFYDLGFVFLFISVGGANIIRLILSIFISHRRLTRPVFIRDTYLWKFFLKESYVLGIAVILSLLTFRINILLLKFLKNPQEVALFQIPFSIIIQLNIVPMALITALFPLLSKLSMASVESFIKIYEKAFKFLIIISFAFAGILYAFSDGIIFFIFGENFLVASPLLKLLSIIIVFLFIGGLFDFILVSINKQNLVMVGWLICFIINFFMAFILIPSYASYGACIASIIAYLILCVIFYYFVSKYLCRIEILDMILKPALATLSMLIFFEQFKKGNIAWQLGFLLLGMGLYGIVLILLRTFTPDEKDLIKNLFFRNVSAIKERL